MFSGVSSPLSVGSSSRTKGARPVFPVQPVEKVSSRPGAVDIPEAERAEGSEATVVNISEEARAQVQRAAERDPGREASELPRPTSTPESSRSSMEVAESSSPPAAPDNPNELSESEEQQVRELRARDAEVRTHEQAHKSVGGQYAGAIHYDFQRGPDGQNYAIGGHVNIDVSVVPDDPAATVAKMQQIVRAALAPAEPSGADRQVAANANGKAAEARAQMAEERAEDVRSTTQNESGGTSVEQEERSSANGGETGTAVEVADNDPSRSRGYLVDEDQPSRGGFRQVA